jgi:hypothetical protein
VVVRCTKKMLDLLGGRTVALSELSPTDDDWYLNLVWIERQKCLLLSHSGTPFSVFRAGVHVADLRPLGATFSKRSRPAPRRRPSRRHVPRA